MPARRIRIASRRLAAAFTLAALVAAGPAAAQSGLPALENRLGATRSQEQQLQSRVRGDTRIIQGFQGRIGDLQQRLDAIQGTLDVETARLQRLQSQLRGARARLVALQERLARDRGVLARQLVAEYESSRPDLVTVVVEARGFADLLERVDGMRRVERSNVDTTTRVASEREQVRRQAARLADLEATQQRQTTAILVQRDEVAQLRLALVSRQQVYVRARDRTSGRLAVLRTRRQRLERAVTQAQARARAAQAASFGLPTATGAPVTGSGDYGFFPAAGTNYSVGEEPELAARLNRLGQALHLHLIGLSGYRTPQHSIEVGGFGNDPHTRGQASDTPGVEGVPEATLEQFGLTRPFGGAAEADHIQLLGG